MIVQPKVRGFICTTSHPKGCEAHVKKQIDYVQNQAPLEKKFKKVLVIGASTGYGLATRIATAFGGGAQTMGVSFEKPASGKRTASAGWYNTAAFEKFAKEKNLYAKSFNGDAFSKAMKQQVIDAIRDDWQGGVDLVVYSLAAPRRADEESGEVYQSVLKPIGQSYEDKTVNVMTGEVSKITLDAAQEAEIHHTEKVMGGEDWQAWIQLLILHGLLAEGAMTLAYSYVGPELTYPIYRHGTIGQAKEHLEASAKALHAQLQTHCQGQAFVSVNKGLVTQASSAIPVVPLYMSLLYRVMKEKNIHEGCIEQMYRMCADRLSKASVPVDEAHRIRLDDWEMREDVQQEITTLWQQVSSDNLEQISDIQGYRQDFYQLFGFELDGIDYQQAVEIDVSIPSLAKEQVN